MKAAAPMTMYTEFFGLRKNPFNTTPDADLLFWTRQHQEALAGLTYAVLGRRGIMVLTGDAGTGKTTLLARLLRNLPVAEAQSSVIVNPTLTPQEFLEAALLDFGFREAPASKAQRVAKLQEFLLKGHRAGKVSALIVDEAHKLSPEVLEEIRLLGNFEFSDQKLLQILLVGQTELDETLRRQELRQFRQRVTLRLSIGPLSPAQVAEYIRFRWTQSGGGELPFTAEAVELAARGSEGIPRSINVVCDNSLLEVYGEGGSRVEARHVRSVCESLQIPLWNGGDGKVEDTAAETLETLEAPIPTLERYLAHARPSLAARLAGKLGIRGS